MIWKESVWYLIRVEKALATISRELNYWEKIPCSKLDCKSLTDNCTGLDWDGTNTLHVSAGDGGWYVGMIKENAVDCYVLRCVHCTGESAVTVHQSVHHQSLWSSEELSQQRSLVTTWSLSQPQCLSPSSVRSRSQPGPASPDTEGHFQNRNIRWKACW